MSFCHPTREISLKVRKHVLEFAKLREIFELAKYAKVRQGREERREAGEPADERGRDEREGRLAFVAGSLQC